MYEVEIMVDTAIILASVLLVLTAAASIEYYNQIRKAHKEYIKARDFIEDIVLSFNRELKRDSDKFESIESKVEGTSSKAETSLRMIGNFEKRIIPFEETLATLSQSHQAMSQILSQNQTKNLQNNTMILSGLTGLETKLKDIEENQETLKNKITSFEDQIQKITIIQPQEIKTDIALPTILIKRDKALAALTDTEMKVLEMLAKEGAKTAPEIKERVQLSREHTARLMKKLYEEGYLEREAGKIPFRYNLKKEMEALLQKAEKPSS
jgi:prophage DNA circulation protein